MIVLKELRDGYVAKCESDDGLVRAVSVPDTTLSGEFELVEIATGRPFAIGKYLDYSRPISQGTMTNERVPQDVWESAVKLMTEWQDHQRKREEISRGRSLARDTARFESRGEMIAQDMDQEGSDL